MNWNAYHFTGDTLRDGSPIPPVGETLVFEGDLKMCARGYHASRKVWQALKFAPGHMLHRVCCAGEIIEDTDKIVCRERTIIASINAETLLRDYARACARDVLHLWYAPDVVREYLETGDEGIRAAAWVAAWDAARDAAWDAARADARGAARAAARVAAWDAARDAARAAQKKQRARLTRMVNEAFA